MLLVIAILLFKDKPTAATLSASSNGLPETQLDRALAENRPTLAFFHSNNCQQCIVMMDVVARVYPDFEHSVILVDVNVYEEANQPLLRRVRLQFIPTLIFYDRSGEAQTHIGVMAPDQLSAMLTALAEGD